MSGEGRGKVEVGAGVSLSRGVWPRSMNLGPQLLVAEFARKQPAAPSKAYWEELTEGFLRIPEALKAVLPLQWLYSDTLETGAAVFWVLLFRMEMQVCGFRIRRQMHFPGKGCRLTLSHKVS